MIREFRPSESDRLFELLKENFPEEEALYGSRPGAWSRVVRRIYRWDVRVLVGLMRALGRPIFRFFTVEVDGRIVATTIVSFTPRAGYISMVMVDTPFRGRGYARALMERAREAAEKAHRRYVALDVLADNAPAIALYRSLGYEDLREVGLFSRVLPPVAPVDATPVLPLPPGLRPYRSRDRDALVAIAARAMPTAVAEVLPLNRRALDASYSLDRILSSESESWVLEQDGAPVAWSSVTVSDAMEAAGLSSPIVGESADPTQVDALLRTGVEWCARRGAARIVCQTPLEHRRSVEALERAGFSIAHRLRTLYRSAAHA
jgi:ribosomal protein S18 acetylase RimI-like enzyme